MLSLFGFRQLRTASCRKTIVSGGIKQGWLFTVISFCFLAVAPATVWSQTGSESIVLRGSVSRTVTLSLGTSATQGRIELIAFESGKVLSLVAAGSGIERDLQVPLLIRSNTSYNLTATVQTQTAVLTQLKVLNVERGGKFVADEAATGVTIVRQFKMAPDDLSTDHNNILKIDVSTPFTILHGPRISVGGAANSLDNALKVLLLLSVHPKPDEHNWTINLKLEASGTGSP